MKPNKSPMFGVVGAVFMLGVALSGGARAATLDFMALTAGNAGSFASYVAGPSAVNTTSTSQMPTPVDRLTLRPRPSGLGFCLEVVWDRCRLLAGDNGLDRSLPLALTDIPMRERVSSDFAGDLLTNVRRHAGTGPGARLQVGMDSGTHSTLALVHMVDAPLRTEVFDFAELNGAYYSQQAEVSAVPVPPAVLLLATALAGLIGIGRFRRARAVTA